MMNFCKLHYRVFFYTIGARDHSRFSKLGL